MADILARVQQFQDQGLPIVLTRAMLFTDKVELLRCALSLAYTVVDI